MKVEVLIEADSEAEDDEILNAIQEAIEDSYLEFVNGDGELNHIPIRVIGVKPSEVV